MNRLQKKCVIATAGAHLPLLLTILIASTGFFEPKPKADDAQILNFIPSTTIDAAFNSQGSTVLGRPGAGGLAGPGNVAFVSTGMRGVAAPVGVGSDAVSTWDRSIRTQIAQAIRPEDSASGTGQAGSVRRWVIVRS